MYNLLLVYDCPNCGKILSDQVTIGEDVDAEREEIYQIARCNLCGSTMVTKRTWKNKNGKPQPCYEEVDNERARWANGFYDDEYFNS